MTKEELRAKIEFNADVVVTYRSQNSKKLKYNVVTVDFDSAYIKDKRCKAVEDEDTLLTFCWDTDSYKLVRVSSVTSVMPLSAILRS